MEEIYVADLCALDGYQHELGILAEQLAARVGHARAGNMTRKTYVRPRFADPHGTAVECISPQVLLPAFFELLAQGLERRGIPARLLGVGVRLCESDAHACQQPLFVEDPAAVD